MTRRFRLWSLLMCISIFLSVLGLSGCQMFSDSSQKSDASSHVRTSAPTSTPTPTTPKICTPTPTPDYDNEAHAEAVATASEHGLTEENLKGHYALFLRFASTIDGNDKLNGYEEIVYALFPMIADQITPDREEHFLGRLGTLAIYEKYLDMDRVGEYYQSGNYIYTNLNFKDSTNVSYTAAQFHELVHFTDTNIDGDIESIRFCENGIFPQQNTEGAILANTDRIHRANFIKEGFAELYTAKYFSRVTESYTTTVQFFTGIEHIIGSEKLDEIFFSHESSYLFARLLLENGFTVEEVWDFYETMDAITYKTQLPSRTVRPEDALIRLYTSIIGPNYMEDAVFCHILRCTYHDKFPFETLPSDYEAELTTLHMEREDAINWFYSIVAHFPDFPHILVYNAPLLGIYLNGEFLITSIAKLVSNETVPQSLQALIIEFDFDAWQPISYSLYPIPRITDS